MQQTRTVELGTGLFVLLGLSALFFLTTQTTGDNTLGSGDTYQVTARFENVGSLKVRAPVSMSGVTIGRVSAIELDPAFLEAKVTLDIDQTYDQIPDDSDAAIQTSGMLGSQYIGIQAGGSETSLAEGSEIEFTQSAIVLENLISKYLFSSGGDDEDEDEQ
jgi:phospholipid/cholesterol/gamma-HCH transport system substrate-binding protein